MGAGYEDSGDIGACARREHAERCVRGRVPKCGLEAGIVGEGGGKGGGEKDGEEREKASLQNMGSFLQPSVYCCAGMTRQHHSLSCFGQVKAS